MRKKGNQKSLTVTNVQIGLNVTLVDAKMDGLPEDCTLQYLLESNEWLKKCKILWNIDLFKFIIGEEAYDYLKKVGSVLKYMEELHRAYFTDVSGEERTILLEELFNQKERFHSQSDSLKIKLWFGFPIGRSIYGKEFWTKKLTT